MSSGTLGDIIMAVRLPHPVRPCVQAGLEHEGSATGVWARPELKSVLTWALSPWALSLSSSMSFVPWTPEAALSESPHLPQPL